MSKTITTRISNKIDTEQNWNSVNLPALEGELIVYSADENNASPRLKVGDGTTIIKDLPFITGGGAAGIPVVEGKFDDANSSTGHYEVTATVEGLTELYNGFQVIIIPPMSAAWNSTYININNLGALPIRRYRSHNIIKDDFPVADSYSINTPLLLVYDTANSPCWIAITQPKPVAEDILGGTLKETIVAYNPGSGEDYTGKQVRNSFLIAEGDDLPTNGANGDICYIYEL